MSRGEPRLHPERCLNVGNRAAGCRRCAVACPLPGAIQLAEGRPVLDPAACVRCGSCLHACPTGALVSEGRLEIGLDRALDAVTGLSVTLVCDRHPSPAESTTSAAIAVQVGRCLAGLSPARLLAASEGRELWLDDTPCADCAIGSAASSLVRSLRLAQSLRSAGGPAGTLHLASAAPSGTQREARVVDAGAPPVTRRELLSGLATRLRAGPQAPLDGGQAGAGPELPIERAQLVAALAGWSPETVDGERPVSSPDLATVEVDAEACSACGLCARACPTRALRFEAIEGRFHLDGLAAACVACRICQNLCSEDALRLLPAVRLADLAAPLWNTLVAGELEACPRCGSDVARRADASAGLCQSCRAAGGPTRQGQDPSGLMADLLQRMTSPEPAPTSSS